MIRAADWVVDLGPGAGPDGGAIVAAATPDRLSAATGSVTAQYLGRKPTTLEKDDDRGRLAQHRAGSRSAARPCITSSTSMPGFPWRP